MYSISLLLLLWVDGGVAGGDAVGPHHQPDRVSGRHEDPLLATSHQARVQLLESRTNRSEST